MKKKLILAISLSAALVVTAAFLAVFAKAAAIPKPQLLSLTSGGPGQMTISWAAVSGAEGYNVYRASGSDTYKITVYDDNGNASFNGPSGYTKLATVDANTTAYTDTTAVDGRTYEYTVEAYTGSDVSGIPVGLFGHTACDVLTCWEIRISNLNSKGFDLTAKVVSATGIRSVNVAVWSTANGQDDLRWTAAGGSNGTYSCHISTADHNNETGAYEIHVVPEDANGNHPANFGDAMENWAYVMVPSAAASLEIPAVNNVSASGYQTALSYRSESGVKAAEAVTWTTANGQDDLLVTAASVDTGNHIIRADISAADHGGATGEYNTTIKMYNNDGTVTSYDFKVNVGNVSNELAVTHIDVGFGDATLLESRGQYLLVDCAESDSVYNVIQLLREKGAGAIPVLLTHQHSDHAGGLAPLIDAGLVSAVYVDLAGHSDVYIDGRKVEENLNYARARGIPVVDARSQRVFQFGTATAEIIGPNTVFGFTTTGATNNQSLWIKVTGGGKSYLLAGDAEMPAERAMVNAGVNINVDFLKVSHHGSRTSTCNEFIRAASPVQAFVSDNRFNASATSPGIQRLSAAGVPVYHTQQVGTILNRITDGSNLIVGMQSTSSAQSSAPALSRYVYNGVDYTNEFDPVYYSNRYADLKAAFGDNEALLLQHWVQFGKRENRTAKDPNANQASGSGSGRSSGKYVYGGVDYTNEFDPVYYSNRYADLKAAFGNNEALLLQHWVQFGKRENRIAKDPNARQNTGSTAGNDSGKSNENSGSKKYVYGGVDYTNEFDPVYYSNRYADLRAAFGNNESLLLQHWVQFGKRENRTAKDPNANRNNGNTENKDSGKSTDNKGNTRYVYGGVDYTNEFDPVYYANAYADLRAAFGNNADLLLQHWVQFGKRENRTAKGAAAGTYVYGGVDYSNEFNPSVYAARYADLRAAFGNNTDLLLQHWVQFGKREGRKAN